MSLETSGKQYRCFKIAQQYIMCDEEREEANKYVCERSVVTNVIYNTLDDNEDGVSGNGRLTDANKSVKKLINTHQVTDNKDNTPIVEQFHFSNKKDYTPAQGDDHETSKDSAELLC